MPPPILPAVRVGTGDGAIQRAFSDLTNGVQTALGKIVSGNIADGVLLKNVPMAFYQNAAGQSGGAAPTALQHNLGRPANGWIVVGQSQQCFFNDDIEAPNKAPNSQLIINHDMVSESPAYASFWVF